jgi:hypothetical protein
MMSNIAQLECIVREQMAEIDQLRATVSQKDQELDVLVAWIAGDGDALARLQAVYSDPRSKIADVIKSSIGALPFERSKPAQLNVVVDFKARVHDARQRTIELRKAEWARQAPLALDSPATILGGDHEGDALDPDPAA